MSKSKRSSASEPEFFADRCLGKTMPRELISRGWVMHLLSDHFPDDAQNVSDPQWIEFGIEHGWSLLTQDARIRRQVVVLELLEAHRACIHCLDSAERPVAVKVDYFHNNRHRIIQNVQSRKYGFFIVTATEVSRRWPSGS